MSYDPNYGAYPGYGAPNPAYSGGYGAPAPGYGAPAPGYGAPTPGYGAPAPGYDPAYGGYGAPAPGYGAPNPAYGTPGYGAPAPGYGAPAPGYGDPAYGGYGAPAPGYGAPAPGYGGYGAPAGYGATTPAYGAPAGYGAPPGHGAPAGYGAPAQAVPAGPLVKVTNADIESYAWENDGICWNCCPSHEWWRIQKNSENPTKVFAGSRHNKTVHVLSIPQRGELGQIKIHPKLTYGAIDGDIEGNTGVIVGGRYNEPYLAVYDLEGMKETLTWNGIGEDFLECVTLSNTTSLQAAGVGKGFVRLFDIATGKPCGRLANTHDMSWKVNKVRGDPFNPHCILLASESGLVYYDLRANARAKTIAGDYRPIYSIEFANQNPMKVIVAHGPMTIIDLGTGTITNAISDPEDDYAYEAAAMYGNMAIGWIRARCLDQAYDFYNLDQDVVRPVRKIKSTKVSGGGGMFAFGKKVLIGSGSWGTMSR